MPSQTRKTHRRLLGTWRSDRRRTLKDWVWPPRTSAKARKRWAAVFGHLVLRYTRTRIHADFKGSKDSQKYEILGYDAGSVVIMTRDSLLKEDRIYHIHFEGEQHYWITLFGQHREWFRRVKPA